MLKFKLTEDGKIEVGENGQPIVIDDSNPDSPREFTVDAIHLYHQIPKLKNDIQTANKAASEAKEALRAFEGIEDADAAREALQTVANLKEGDLKKASDVQAKIDALNKENVAKIEALNKQNQQKLAEKDEALARLDADLRKSVISQAFAASSWFNGKEPKSKLGPAVAESFLGKNFKVERLADGSVVPVAYIGETRLEDPAKGMIGDALAPMSFDDAMTKIVESHPQASDILWPSSGSGSTGNKGGSGYRGVKTINGEDPVEFGKNLEDIANGKTKVVRS